MFNEQKCSLLLLTLICQEEPIVSFCVTRATSKMKLGSMHGCSKGAGVATPEWEPTAASLMCQGPSVSAEWHESHSYVPGAPSSPKPPTPGDLSRAFTSPMRQHFHAPLSFPSPFAAADWGHAAARLARPPLQCGHPRQPKARAGPALRETGLSPRPEASLEAANASAGVRHEVMPGLDCFVAPNTLPQVRAFPSMPTMSRALSSPAALKRFPRRAAWLAERASVVRTPQAPRNL